MKIRFTKAIEVDGITTGIVDDKVIVNNVRFSFYFGQIIDVVDIVQKDNGFVEIINESGSFTISSADIEVIKKDSNNYTPSGCGCNKR